MKVAVVGGGASGLAAASVLVREGVEVVVYEKEDTLGGKQATTSTINGIVLDLGATVFSQVFYPDVVELFESLGVDKEVSSMLSLSVSLNEGCGWEWGNQNGLSSLFVQKRNALNPSFWKMIQEIVNFKNDASIYIEELENNLDINRNITLEQFVQSRGYSELFQKAYLIPTCSSIWSYPSQVMSFSAYFVLSFLRDHHASEKELESGGCRIRTNYEVHSISTNDNGCIVICKDGMEDIYDSCIIAMRAPDAINILGKQATCNELRILSAFQYACSGVFLHHDISLMPKNPLLWSSKNFLETKDGKAYITYWLNIIQNIGETKLPFLLTLNTPQTPKSTVFKWSTSCLIPSIATSKASSDLNLIQGKRGLWFCGSYEGYGLPGDGVQKGISVANVLLKKTTSIENNLKRAVPSWPEAMARILLTRFFERFISTGCLILMEEGGTLFSFEGTKKKSNLKVNLRVHNPQFYWKVATKAELGFADAYINGDFSFVDKKEGLLNCFLIFAINTDLYNQTSKLEKKRGWWTPMLYTSIVASTKYFFQHVARKNTLSRVRKNISQHYDLSNELFSLFLDETMTYSCAIFQNPNEDLKTAQLRKVHTLIKKARINNEHHMLEIGCGWGSLAFEAVKLIGCKYTGITLSEKQFQYVQQKVEEAGLQDQMELILCDYRELPKGCKYDRIISCEMLESVGHEYLDDFFRCCESALAPNGIIVLQFGSVADAKYDEYRHSPSFIKEYIFPGGCIPSLSRVTYAMANGSKLSVVHLEEIGCHYFYTLQWWKKKFLQNKSEVLALGFDEKFIRTWEYYLDYCAAGFKLCYLGDYQIVLSRPGDVVVSGNYPYNPVPYPD